MGKYRRFNIVIKAKFQVSPMMRIMNDLEHFIRRICKYLGTGLRTLDLEFAAVTDEHFEHVTFPEGLKSLNLNGCREISERTLVVISKHCKNLERIGKIR
jgi:hypothetical protein